MSPNPLPPLLSLPFTLSSLHQQLIGLPFADPQGGPVPPKRPEAREKDTGLELKLIKPIESPTE